MPDENDQVVGSLSRDLVLHLAPEELPLYPSLVAQFQSAKPGRKASSDDQVLGFGVAEALTMLTPVILTFTLGFWQALVAEVEQDSAHGVLEYVKARLRSRSEGSRREASAAEPSPLTPGQLQVVRTVAERVAGHLDLPEGQAGLLADAIVGVLSVPAVS
jgi:hypothetical protein